jgi:putative ABC transport system permease protein
VRSANWQRVRYTACIVLHDLRYAVRALLRTPTFTAVGILTLALGIGANTAAFSLIRAVFLGPLPFDDAERLVTIAERRATSRSANIPVSGHEYAAWKEQNHVFDGVALARPDRLTLSGAGEPQGIDVLRVSSDYFSVVGLHPAAGRLFAAGEDTTGRDTVVVLSDRLWRSRFASDDRILGRTITLDDQPLTVVGVMSPLPESLSPDAWLPIDVPEHLRAVGRHNLNVVARLHPSATPVQAQRDLEVISRRLAEEMPNDNTGHAVIVTALRESLVGEFRPASLLMLAAVGFVLLIGCANVANLLLARGAARHKEIAVRTALGAGRARVVRQLLAESVVLAAAGGWAGLLLSAWMTDLVPKLPGARIPLVETAHIDWRSVLAATAVSLLTGMLAGMVPAVRSSHVHPSWLREGNRMSDDRGRQRVRMVLVASEVALTLMLLVGAGLMLKSFVRLMNVPRGFDTKNALVVPIELPTSRYPSGRQRQAFVERAIAGVQTISGVDAAGAVSHLPLGGADNWMAFAIEGRPTPSRGQEPYAPFRVATADYFKALGIPVRRGRVFRDSDARIAVPLIRWFPQQPYPDGFDRPQPAPVAVISETAARQFWPGEDPIGRRIRMLFSPDTTIVGIVGDVRHNGLNLPAYPHIYLSHNQEPWGSMSLVVRISDATLAAAPLIRERLRAADATLPIAIRTMDEVLATATAQPRLYALLTGIFGAVALALAVIGIFGVGSYVAAQRTREIGVRMALGAQPREILGLVIGQGMRPVIAGIVIGLGGALGVTRFMKQLLFGVAPVDALTFTVVVLIVAAVGLIACWIPARRATRVDPLTALRAE